MKGTRRAMKRSAGGVVQTGEGRVHGGHGGSRHPGGELAGEGDAPVRLHQLEDPDDVSGDRSAAGRARYATSHSPVARVGAGQEVDEHQRPLALHRSPSTSLP